MRKVALVTGSSSGIGAATARALAKSGHDLVLTWHSDQQGAEGVAETARASGARVIVIRTDCGLPENIQHLYAMLDANFGRIDLLVNNAGMVDRAARLEEMSLERITRMLRVNTIGALLVAAQAVRRMAFRYGGKGGVIVNVSSRAAVLGGGGTHVDYAASKGALDTLTKGLADENALEGIRVVGVRPGLIETPLHGRGGDPERAARLATNVPMQRPGSAEEVAEAIVWLASDAASYVTGTMLDVAGGR